MRDKQIISDTIACPMEENDIGAVKTMLIEFYGHLNGLGYIYKLNTDFLDDYVRLMLDSRLGKIILLKQDGRDIGFVSVNAPRLNKKYVAPGAKNIGVISEIYVRPEYRGRGYAKKLFAAAGEFLKTLGISHVMAEVVENNKASFALFGSLKFSPFYTVMMKELDNGKDGFSVDEK